MRILKNKKSFRYAAAAAAALSALTIASLGQIAHAGTMSQTFVRFDRMKIGTATTGTVCAKPATAGTEASVVVTFPTGYTLGAYTTFTVNTTSTNMAWPSGGTAWLGITAPTGAGDIVGQSVTFASSDLVVGTLYCFNWTNSAAVTVKGSATASNTGTVVTQASGPSTIDSGDYATASISDDQIVVSATVPVAFSFTLTGTTDALGTLSTGSVSSSSSPSTATVNTNAKNGWIVWAKDSNAGLTSATASYTIPAKVYAGSPSTVTAGSEGYNMGVTKTQAGGSGTLTVDPGFDGTVAHEGGGLTTNFHSIATSTGSADTAVLTMTNNVAIKGSTPAATDYTDTITVVGAGLF